MLGLASAWRMGEEVVGVWRVQAVLVSRTEKEMETGLKVVLRAQAGLLVSRRGKEAETDLEAVLRAQAVLEVEAEVSGVRVKADPATSRSAGEWTTVTAGEKTWWRY